MKYSGKSFLKGFEHLGDAAFLLFHIGMYIQIKRCRNVGMAE